MSYLAIKSDNSMTLDSIPINVKELFRIITKNKLKVESDGGIYMYQIGIDKNGKSYVDRESPPIDTDCYMFYKKNKKNRYDKFQICR